MVSPLPIAPEIVAHLESPGSVIVGSVAEDGWPLAAHAYGARIEDGRVRVVLNGAEAELLADLAATGVAAVSVTDVPTLRSIQLKGRVVDVGPATTEDRLRTDRWRAGFFAVVHEVDGTPYELLEHLVAAEYAALVVEVEELYDQTPGPQAGTSLGAAGA